MRKLEDKNYVEISCEIRHKTEKAVLIHDGTQEAWIPFSQIESPDEDEMEIGEHTEIMMTEWIATEKGLI